MLPGLGRVSSLDVGPGTVDGSFALLAVALRWGFNEAAHVATVVVFFRLGGRTSRVEVGNVIATIRVATVGSLVGRSSTHFLPRRHVTVGP